MSGEVINIRVLQLVNIARNDWEICSLKVCGPWCGMTTYCANSPWTLLVIVIDMLIECQEELKLRGCTRCPETFYSVRCMPLKDKRPLLLLSPSFAIRDVIFDCFAGFAPRNPSVGWISARLAMCAEAFTDVFHSCIELGVIISSCAPRRMMHVVRMIAA